VNTFLSTVQEVEVPVYDQGNVGPPRIWWHNGDRKARTGGTFYTKDTELADAPGKPWEQVERFEGEVGYTTGVLHVAPIAIRSQPFFSVRAGGQETRTWLAKWQPGAQLYSELLCYVQGIDEPVTWCAKGLAGKALSQILKTYQTGLLREAVKAANKPLPLWTFWLPIATKVDAGNKVVYEDTGHGSFVTPPALRFPDKPHAELIEKYFVGKEILERGAQIRQEYDGWLREKRAVGEGMAAAAAEASTDNGDVADELEVPFN
jgi:hypothetical protein